MSFSTAAVMALLTFLNLAIARGDSSTFTEAEAQRALASYVQKNSEGKITLASFKKTNGQKSEFAGIKGYRMDFEAQIQFEITGSWLKGMAMDTKLSFEVAQGRVNKGSWADFNNSMQGGIPVSRGSRATIAGYMEGQGTENGWQISVGDNHLVSGPRGGGHGPTYDPLSDGAWTVTFRLAPQEAPTPSIRSE